MAFLDVLKDVLGGWQGMAMQEKYGPDWRQQRAAKDFALQQQQAEEERARREFQRKQQEFSDIAASEAALAPGVGEDIIGYDLAGLPEAQRRFKIAQRVGKSAQAKSSIEAQRQFGQREIATLRLEAQKEVLRNTQEFQREMQDERLRAQQEGRAASEEAALSRTMAALRYRTAHAPSGAGGTKGTWKQDENGEWVYITVRPGATAAATEAAPEAGAAPGAPPGVSVTQTGVKGLPTAVERTRKEQAGHVIQQGQGLLQELNGPVSNMIGPGAGWVSGVRNVAGVPPAEVRHLSASLGSMSMFLPILHGMRGGENMIEHFQDILGSPYRYSADAIGASVRALMEAAARIKTSGDSADLSDLANQLAAIRQTAGGGGGGETRTYQGHTYRLKPGANPKYKASWEMIQ
jgi:hypothetical protein